MRKILLASAAMLGATAGLASAQTAAPNPMQGQVAAPYGAMSGANDGNNYTAATTKGPIANPAPGTVVVRLNGRIEVDVSANSTFADKTATNKLAAQGVGSYFRLYTGIDGLTTNGIRYGGVVELRENWGPQNGSGSSNSSTQTMFVRRVFTYIANDKVGLLRVGQGDGTIGLFDGGVITGQAYDAGDGNLNGGTMQQEIPTGVAPPFVWLSQAGAEYGNNKIVYLSPQFMGFDASLQYAPNSGNSFGQASGNAPCPAATSTCSNVSASTIAADSSRWMNQYVAGLRYQGTFGPVALQAFGAYEGSGKVSDSAVGAVKYDNLGFYTGGAAVTFAGLTASADYIGGAVNGQLGMRPSGGVSMNAEIFGLMYKTGALTLGANLGVIDHQGATGGLVGVTQRHEVETSIGGNYVLAPGLALVAEYMYMQRHQGGFDFVTSGYDNHNNTVKAQGVMVGTVVSW